MEKISDYTGYDYKTKFWTKNREYEHIVDLETINSCLNKYKIGSDKILDAGCGFGRLLPAYIDHFKEYTLFDYAHTLLNQAKETYKNLESVRYVQGNLYELPFLDKEFDSAISIRTLHHINNLELFIKNIHRCLNSKGLFIFDVPNKIHLKNRLKHLVTREPHDLYSLDKLIYMETYVNHHPKTVEQVLETQGFEILEILNTNLLRLNFLKKLIPTQYLIKLDKWTQCFVKKYYWSPSLYYITIKK